MIGGAILLQTCGLEILYQRATKSSLGGGGGGGGAAGGGPPINPVCWEPKWQAFLQKLRVSGYFEGEIEGSRKHREKLAAAEEYFASVQRHCQEEGEGWQFDGEE